MDDMRNSTDNDALGCDASFGPSASACHPPRFDFTLFFEQSILTIVPCVLLLLALIPRVVHLSRSRRKVLRHRTDAFKPVAYTCLIALQLTLLVLWPSHGGRTTSTSIIAASLVLVDGLALAVLSYLEHRRSIRPSSIILAYLILSIAFDATQCRTLWLLAESSVAPVFTSALACKLLLFFLELAEKRYILLPPWKALSPETTSSIISKGFFWWLNSLLLRGFRATLSTDSIYDIDDALKSKGLLDKLLGARQRWEMSRRFHRYRLLLATCDSIRRPLATTALPRLCLIGFKFAQPFLIKSVVSHVDGVHVHDRFRMEAAYALVAATAFVFLGKAISHGFYQHQLFRTLTMIRGALVSLIFLQTLNLSVVSSDTQNVAALTHVGPDVMSISKAFESVHEIWANPIEIGLAIWLLSRELGPGCVGPAVAVITCTAAMTKLSKYMGPAMKVWNEAIQRRISATSNVMGFMREVKMLGMVPLWTTTIQSLRVAELQCSKRFRIFIAYLNVLGNAPSALAPLISFGVAIALAGKSSQQSLSISAAFTSLSIISLIAEPLAHLLASVPSFVSSFGSFDRIEAFLQQGQTALSTSLACQHDQHESSNDKDPILAANLELVPILNQQCDTFKVEKASFLLRQGCMPILKDLTFTIRPSTLTIVTGKVGSGKTMLLLALLGELQATGKVQLPKAGVAFCSQSTWLVHGTIKNNILGPMDEALDEEWYRTIIRACALEKDFEHLHDGDEFLVGSNGLTLSGGQRQRLSLARALYSRKRVVIADDIFSGLDPETRQHVWTHVFGPSGLLRRHGITVVLATHTLDFLKDADHIIILDHGKIAHQGSFDKLCASVPILQQQQGGGDLSSSVPIEEGSEKKTRSGRNLDEAVDDADDLSRRTGDSSLYMYYFQSIGWKLGLTALFWASTQAFLAQFSSIWVKWWTEANKSQSDVNTAMYYGVYATILCVWIGVIGIDCWYMFVVLIPRSAEWLHWKLLKTTMGAPMAFFHSTDVGNLVNRFSQDMSLVDRELPTAAYTSLADLLSCIGEALLIILGAKYIAATLPLAIVLLYALQKFYLRTSRQLRVLDLQAKSPLYTQLLEIHEGLSTIRAFQWQSAIAQSSLELLDRSQRPHYLLLSIQRWLTLVLDLLVTVAAVLLVVFSVLSEDSAAGNVAVAMYSVLGLSQSLANLLSSWTSLETSLGAISRLKKFVKCTRQEIEPSAAGQVEPTKSWPATGKLEWQNVEAFYSRTQGDDPVLRDISLKVQSGQKVAICGRTGSGKSSLLSTLFGLLDYSGTIMIDEIDISSISNQTLRSSLIVVPQQPVLFQGSLRSNLVSQPCSTQEAQLLSDAELIALLKRLEVWDAGFQNKFLDTDTADLSLSFGQKQLLCLARAILRKEQSKIVILDEAMSGVDQHTEELMVRALEREFAGHTIVSIVHRLHTIRSFDRLVVLDKGRIVDIGTPSELLTANAQLKRATVTST